MSAIRHIFMLGEDKESRAAAELLSGYLTTQNKSPVDLRPLSLRSEREEDSFYSQVVSQQEDKEEKSLQTTTASQLEKLFFICPFNDSFDASGVDELVKHISRSFAQDPAEEKTGLDVPRKMFASKDKDKIRDIYIFGGNVGLSSPRRNDSMAQTLANELYLQGFLNVRVHALAYEKQDMNQVMTTDIYRDRTLSADISASHLYIYAYIHNQKKELEDEQGLTNSDERQAEQRPLMVVGRKIPFPRCLDWSTNIFFQNENYRDRSAFIAQSLEREKAKKIDGIQIINNAFEAVREKGNPLSREQEKIKDSMIEALKKEDDYSTLEQICQDYEGPLKQQKIFIKYNLDFYERLHGGLPEIVGIPEEEEFQVQIINKQEQKNDKLPQRESSYLEKIIINSLNFLQQEKIQLEKRSSFFSCFTKYEKNTKIAKIICLKQLLYLVQSGDIDGLRRSAENYLTKRRVTWRFKNTTLSKKQKQWAVSRTRDLLQEILVLLQNQAVIAEIKSCAIKPPAELARENERPGASQLELKN